MIGIAWRILRRQTGALLGALIMTAVGCALLTSFVVMQESVAQTRAPVERYAEAEIVAAGEDGVFTTALLSNIERMPGVSEVVSELNVPAQLLRQNGEPVVSDPAIAQFGHAWSSARLTPFEVVAGTPPSAAGEVVLDASLAQAADVEVGEKAAIAIAGTVHEFQVSGIVDGLSAADSYQRALFFTADEAASLADRGPGRSDAFAVMLESGAEPARTAAQIEQQIESALGGDVSSPSGIPSFRVAIGAERGELEGAMPDHRAAAGAMTMLIWIVAFMAIAVISGALITSVRRRSAQFSLLRAIGATPRQVRALCHSEALLISVIAIAIGSLLGIALAWGLVEVFKALELLSPFLTLQVGPQAVFLSAAIEVAVTQIAAWLTARQTLQFQPGDALAGRTRHSTSRRRALLGNLIGAALLVAAGLLQIAGMSGLLPNALSASYGMIASGLVIVSIGLLGSLVTKLIAGTFRRPVALVSPAGGYLASANVRFHHRRFAGVAAPLAVGVAIAGWALSGLPLFALNNATNVADRFAAGYVVSTPLVQGAPVGLSEETRAAIAQLEGVEATVGLSETWFHATSATDRAVDTSAITRGTIVAGQVSQLLNLGEVDGDLERVDRGEGIALGEEYALRGGITLGERVLVRLTGAGTPVPLEVVALFDAERGGQQAAVVSQKALGESAGRQRFDTVLVSGSGGVLTARSIENGVAGSTVSVETHAEFLDAYVEQRQAAIDNLGTIAVVLVGLFLVVASVNALTVSAADRSSELSALRRINATPRQIRSMVGWEMVLTVLPAWLLGMAATLWMAIAMAGGDVGAALWAFPTVILLLIGLFGVLLAVGGGLTATTAVQRGSAHRESNQ